MSPGDEKLTRTAFEEMIEAMSKTTGYNGTVNLEDFKAPLLTDDTAIRDAKLLQRYGTGVIGNPKTLTYTIIC